MSVLTSALQKAGIPFREKEPLSAHTTFRIGGAACMAFPRTVSELRMALSIAADSGVGYRILGNGSDILAPDAGVRPLVICTKGMAKTAKTKYYIEAEAGVMLPTLLGQCVRTGYGGAEALAGIPATVGGAVCMNAGAFGAEIASFVRWVRVLRADDFTPQTLTPEELSFSYRHSVLQKRRDIVCSVAFSFAPVSPSDAGDKIKEYAYRRRASQPAMPSAGSYFRRNDHCIPAQLIDRCALKGMRSGGAAVSEKHAGFIVNLGTAKAADVLFIADTVRRRVAERFGVTLCPEVEIW